MSDSTQHTIKVRAFNSAYPGSMFEKPHGSHVERDDAASLAAALLEIIVIEKRSVSDLTEAIQESRDEYHELKAERDALKAQRDELLAGLQMAYIAMQHMGNVLNNIDAVDEEEDAQHDAAFEAVAALIAKHKGASHG